jgi:hypothetical protein
MFHFLNNNPTKKTVIPAEARLAQAMAKRAGIQKLLTFALQFCILTFDF